LDRRNKKLQKEIDVMSTEEQKLESKHKEKLMLKFGD